MEDDKFDSQPIEAEGAERVIKKRHWKDPCTKADKCDNRVRGEQPTDHRKRVHSETGVVAFLNGLFTIERDYDSGLFECPVECGAKSEFCRTIASRHKAEDGCRGPPPYVYLGDVPPNPPPLARKVVRQELVPLPVLPYDRTLTNPSSVSRPPSSQPNSSSSIQQSRQQSHPPSGGPTAGDKRVLDFPARRPAKRVQQDTIDAADGGSQSQSDQEDVEEERAQTEKEFDDLWDADSDDESTGSMDFGEDEGNTGLFGLEEDDEDEMAFDEDDGNADPVEWATKDEQVGSPDSSFEMEGEGEGSQGFTFGEEDLFLGVRDCPHLSELGFFVHPTLDLVICAQCEGGVLPISIYKHARQHGTLLTSLPKATLAKAKVELAVLDFPSDEAAVNVMAWLGSAEGHNPSTLVAPIAPIAGIKINLEGYACSCGRGFNTLRDVNRHKNAAKALGVPLHLAHTPPHHTDHSPVQRLYEDKFHGNHRLRHDFVVDTNLRVAVGPLAGGGKVLAALDTGVRTIEASRSRLAGDASMPGRGTQFLLDRMGVPTIIKPELVPRYLGLVRIPKVETEEWERLLLPLVREYLRVINESVKDGSHRLTTAVRNRAQSAFRYITLPSSIARYAVPGTR
ncbi:hypothetical protein P7C70_g9105, partial [Phenoliferia sp. Uapishka_3]